MRLNAKGGAGFLVRKKREKQTKNIRKEKSRVLSQAVNVRSEPRAHADLSSASLS